VDVTLKKEWSIKFCILALMYGTDRWWSSSDFREALGKKAEKVTNTTMGNTLWDIRNGLVCSLVRTNKKGRKYFHKLHRVAKTVPLEKLLKVGKKNGYYVKDLAKEYPQIQPLLVKTRNEELNIYNANLPKNETKPEVIPVRVDVSSLDEANELSLPKLIGTMTEFMDILKQKIVKVMLNN